MLSKKGLDPIVVPLDTDWAEKVCAFDGCRHEVGSGVDVDATAEAYETDPTSARVRSGGGPSIQSAMVFKFCTIAARWNSSRAPERPRSRIRSTEHHREELVRERDAWKPC
jgi:hypothetical protein